MRGRPRVAILLPDLRPGGAERLHATLARRWVQDGIDIDFVLRQGIGQLIEEIPPEAKVFDMRTARVRRVLWPLMNYLRDRSPTAILAAMWPLTVICPLAARLVGYTGRVVISEHAPQSLAYAKRGRLHGFLMRASMRLCYPLADQRVAVSRGVAEDMSRLSGLAIDRFHVIHNPAATGRVIARSGGELPITGNGPLILTVGNLKQVKRHDLLIRSFARLPAPTAQLVILGEGTERSRLECLARELGVGDRIHMPGFQADPGPWYAAADLFVLSSDHEGFGNVIVEALEQGTPVVSTDCPSGPREILGDGTFGTLVRPGDVDALALAMEEALAKPCDRDALRQHAKKFSVDAASSAYLPLLLGAPPQMEAEVP